MKNWWLFLVMVAVGAFSSLMNDAVAASGKSKLVLPRSDLTFVETVVYSIRQPTGLDWRSRGWHSYDDGYSNRLASSPTSGRVSVFIPSNRPFGGDLIPSSGNPLTNFSIENIEEIENTDLLKVMKDISDNSPRRTLLYVHGFRTPFTFAIINSIRLKIDTNNPNTLVFVWPGDSKQSIPVEYFNAEIMEHFSKYYLGDFLLKIADENTIDVIAHSMGGRLFFDALLSEPIYGKIHSAILMAPDIDIDRFVKKSAFIAREIGKVYVYCNPDVALFFSWVWHGQPRLGSCFAAKRVADIEVKYASGVTGFERHDYFVKSRIVLREIAELTAK